MVLINISFFTSEAKAPSLSCLLADAWLKAVKASFPNGMPMLSKLLTHTQPGAETFSLQWRSIDEESVVAWIDSAIASDLFKGLKREYGDEVMTFTSMMEVIGC